MTIEGLDFALREPGKLISTAGERIEILGVPVSLVDMEAAVDAIIQKPHTDGPGVVFVREVASLMLAADDAGLRALHHQAFLVVPDGMPLVWIGRFRGHGDRIGRVAGADLLDEVCRATLKTGQSHYFFGGKAGVAEKLSRRLRDRHPGLKVVGTYSPPIREIDHSFELAQEALEEVEKIRRLKPDFVWVGISSPKQEFWMAKAAPIVGGGVFLGVGAAFDFQSGELQRAPEWLQRIGLEWFHRLLCEPRRLWRRYLILAPRFVLQILFEQIAMAKRRK